LETFFRAASIADAPAAVARLSERYRTISELLSAEPAILAVDAGVEAAAALEAVRALTVQAAGDELRERPALLTHDRVAHLLRTLIGFRSDECLIVLFLDGRRGLIDHEIIAVGRADAVDFDQRRIILRAICRGACGIILAHNHPSGDPTPSSSDWRATRQLADGARALGIYLQDHLVVAGGKVRSAMFA
jgi:DNA repair protein RadC